MRAAGAWLVLCLFGGVSTARAADPPIAHALTAVGLHDELEANPSGWVKRYAGKWVTLTGKVEVPRPGGEFGPPTVWLDATDPAKTPTRFRTIPVIPRKADRGKYQGMMALAKGQEVTFRGRFSKAGVSTTEWELVKVAPSPALPVTPSGLLAALNTSAGKEKYVGKDVVCRAEVRKAEWNGTTASLIVWDPGAKGGPGLEASLYPGIDKKAGQALAAIQPGTVVVLLGEAQTTNDGRIWDVRVLTEPPEGVKLPGDEK